MHRNDGTLWALARCPFLTAEDLTLLTSIRPRTARDQLLRLCRDGLVDSLSLPGTCQHVYYLTPAGIAAAAAAAETDPVVLAARYGLGERALLRRLPTLERLVAGRRVLLALQRDLIARGGALEQWRVWPVPWPSPEIRGMQRRMLYLDGEGVLRLPGEGHTRRAIGVLWDGDGDVPHAVLDERLTDLDRLYAHTLASGLHAPRVPPVLLITAASERIPSGYRPHVLWTTCAEIARCGALGAAWRGAGLRGEAARCAPRWRRSGRCQDQQSRAFPSRVRASKRHSLGAYRVLACDSKNALACSARVRAVKRVCLCWRWPSRRVASPS